MDVSIIIVNYNTKELLKKAIESLYMYPCSFRMEIFVVDNTSTDDSVTYLKSIKHKVYSIINKKNVGFSRANNQAIKKANGRYVLLLNPDTEIKEGTLDQCIHYMDNNSQIGILGCKVLLPDGSLDLACRRSFPNIKNSFFKFTGLAKLFPNHKLFSEYNLTYLDQNKSYSVDSVVGAFMMVRRETIEQIGLLDEGFFMYGEDLDWCYRTKQAGWDVFYYADASIIHHKRASSRKSRKALIEFYKAMEIFYKKHYAHKKNGLVNWMVYSSIRLLMCFKFILNEIKILLIK